MDISQTVSPLPTSTIAGSVAHLPPPCRPGSRGATPEAVSNGHSIEQVSSEAHSYGPLPSAPFNSEGIPNAIPIFESSSIEQIPSSGPSLLTIAGVTVGAGAIALLLLHTGGAALPAIGAASTGTTATTTATVASFSQIATEGASVVVPLVALGIAAHEAEHFLHALQRNASNIATGLVTAFEITHPSLLNMLSAGLTTAVAHPIPAIITIIVGGGMIAHDLRMPRSTIMPTRERDLPGLTHHEARLLAPQLAQIRNNQHYHTEGTITRRLVRITVNGTAAALLATHPEAIALAINGAVHGIGTALAAVSSHATAATSTSSLPVAASLVPHSLAAPTAVSIHSGLVAGSAAISMGKAALMTAVAAHPIGVAIGLTASAFMLAATLSKGDPITATAPSTNSQLSSPPVTAPVVTPTKRFRPALI